MSNYENELSGVSLDELKDQRGWLEGVVVTIKEGRFFKQEQKFKDEKNDNAEVVRHMIGVKVMATTQKNGKEVRVGEYSTGISWDSDSVGVSPDGKALVAKKPIDQNEKKKLVGKNTPWALFLRSAVDAGISESKVSVFRADSVDGITFQMTNEKTSPQAKRT